MRCVQNTYTDGEEDELKAKHKLYYVFPPKGFGHNLRTKIHVTTYIKYIYIQRTHVCKKQLTLLLVICAIRAG